MKNKIPCEVIKDLLPSYIDGITSEKSNEEIKEHLGECEDCRSIYEKMSGAEMTAALPEIDGLKKIRSGNRKRILWGICITAVVLILCAGIKVFFYGSPMTDYSFVSDITCDGENALFTGSFVDSATVYSHYKVEQVEGGREVVIYGALSSVFNRDGSFKIQMPLGEETLYLNGASIDSEGLIVSKTANELYNARNPYIGDIPANGKLVTLLEIPSELGNFKNYLQTGSEPYSWTLNFEGVWTDNTAARNDLIMRNDAMVLLALIDNCSEIKWSYIIDEEGKVIERSMTVSQASEILGEDVKGFAESPERVQELLEKVGL